MLTCDDIDATADVLFESVKNGGIDLKHSKHSHHRLLLYIGPADDLGLNLGEAEACILRMEKKYGNELRALGYRSPAIR